MRRSFSVGGMAMVVAVASGLAACDSSQSSSPSKSSAASKAVTVAAEWIDGRLEIDVPVPVITFGLTTEQAAALAQDLSTHQVNHTTGDFNQIISMDTEEPQEQGIGALQPLGGETFPNPVLPTAVYHVQVAPPALAEEFQAALAAAKLDGSIYDANAMEDFLAGALPRYGFALNADAPSMVVLHLGAFGINGHGWKVQGDTGFMQPVRLFGARQPLLVLDPSAIADPYAGTSEDYMNPVEADNAAVIARYLREATEFRVLQGPIYPVAQAPCHAVTAVVGVKAASLSQLPIGVLRSFEDAFRPEVIKASFDHLTGTDVFFDVKILSLPVDDPALDAISRLEFPGVEVMRGYFTAMWENYHVDHPGCEEYLSALFIGDAAGVPGAGILGIGTYDDNPGKRISMSWVHDVFRFLLDPESPGCAVGAQVFSTDYCERKDYLNWWEYLLSHETGHILGQRHPHDIDSSSSNSGSSNAFSSVWSSMSYQQDGRMIDFGAHDQANWRRNRAGFALKIAADAGREGTPAWESAMAAARRLDWQGVWESLQP